MTQGNLTAMAQLMVYQAARRAKEYEQEIARREELARFSGGRALASSRDKKLVMAHAQSDAAKNLMVARRRRFRPMKDCETTRTRATCAMVAGLTQGNLFQLMVRRPRSARESGDSAARRTGSFRRPSEAQITFDAQQAGIAARVDSMREGLLFRVPALYGPIGVVNAASD